MPETCIVVADGSRARFFVVTPRVPRLQEVSVLVDPERRSAGRETFSDVKSGRKQSPGGGAAHGMDDHRDRHREEAEDRFAKRIAQEAAGLGVTAELIVVAEPHLLGRLRPHLVRVIANTVGRTEVAADLSMHPPTRIEHILEKRGILTVRPSQPPWRPRGQL